MSDVEALGATQEELSTQFLLFNLADTHLGFPLGPIRLVLRAAELMQVPTFPGGPIGLLDMHGEMLAVYDLRTLMRMPATSMSPEKHFIVAAACGTREAFLVDDIDEVVDFKEHRVETPDASNLPPFVSSMVRYNSRLILCLSEDLLGRRQRPEF